MKGRISRHEFWLGYGATIVILYLLKWNLENFFFYIGRPISGPWYRNEIVFALAAPKVVAHGILLWPLTVIYIKRLHDLNLSGWWLLVLVAIAVATYLTIGDRWEPGFFDRNRRHWLNSRNAGQ